jgi:hypothetical protein
VRHHNVLEEIMHVVSTPVQSVDGHYDREGRSSPPTGPASRR